MSKSIDVKRKLLIRDVTLRDGQQSLFATRMNQQQVERVLPYFRDAGFYALEVWGGAVPDSIMRVDTASAFTGISEYQPLPKPFDFKAEWADKVVSLS